MTRDELTKALGRCVQCGQCLAKCPIYNITGREGSSARGKLALLKAELEGRADLASRMKDLLSNCLLCGACAEECSVGVKPDGLIQASRALAVKETGFSQVKRLLARDLMAQGLVSRLGVKNQALFLKRIPRESGLRLRFPVPGFDKDRALPPLAPRPFLSCLTRRETGDKSGPRIALFVGCLANYSRVQSARAAVELLTAAGARVLIPRLQLCCGKPALTAGDTATALYLARKNLKVFNPDDYDFLAAFCATCSEHLKGYDRLEGLDIPGDWTGKVRDISELLVNDLNWRPTASETGRNAGEQGVKLRVFYHDPCHLRRKQGIYLEPRALITSLPGVELVGGELPPACCGHGGLFNLWHYELSRRIMETRMEPVSDLKPDAYVTACSGCLLAFEDYARTEAPGREVLSLVELIAARGL